MPPARAAVDALAWDEFLSFFEARWNQGEHIAVVAPTGAGKTTFVTQILRLRRFVLAPDIKGGDETLEATGWPRLDSWPGVKAMDRLVSKNEEAGRPSRYLVGPRVVAPADFANVKRETASMLNDAFIMGHWTVYLDELQLLTDRRMMNLGSQVDTHLIAARNKGLSIVSSYQAPSWVTPSASRMATWVCVAFTRDADSVNTIAERMGRPKAEVRGAVDALHSYHWLIVGRNPRDPYILTRPPPV